MRCGTQNVTEFIVAKTATTLRRCHPFAMGHAFRRASHATTIATTITAKFIERTVSGDTPNIFSHGTNVNEYKGELPTNRSPRGCHGQHVVVNPRPSTALTAGSA